jgi:hypothetical protein
MPTTKPTTIVLAAVEFDAPAPSIPEGATDWERQELQRLWSNALCTIGAVAQQAAHLHASTLTDTEPPNRPHTGGGGLVYNANQAEAALVAYHQLHQATRHRLALAEREAQG